MSRPSSKDGKDGEDLNSILDESQRADVTLLVANCTEAMRAILIENFDAEAGLDKSLLPKATSDEEKFMAADPTTADVAACDNERKLKEECEKDIASAAKKKLKQDALNAYDEWREQVMMRVGEVVNTKSTVRDQLEKDTVPTSPKPKAPNTVGKVMDAPDQDPILKFKDLFPPTKTPLTKLPIDRRTLILHAILLLLISLEHYNAYSRILMLSLTSSLKLSLKTFEQDEYTTAKGLLESAKELSANEETQKKQQENRENRKWKVGLATAAGAAILGVSGGLAAPLVASGVGSVMGGLGLGATAAAGYLGSVAGSTLLVGGLFGAYGGRMTGQMMDKYAREVEDFEFLAVHSDKKTSEDEEQAAQEASEHDHKLRVTICISGWLTDKSEVTKPWRVLGVGAEVFGLKWELEALLNLGHAMDGMMQSAAWGYAQKELIKRTIFADLMAAFWPIGLLKVARVLDNPFSVAKARADKAGEVLADALINKAQGERPVTLIGYSLGARVIYTCLKTLAERKAFGLIENAVIIGAPAPSDMPHWRVLRTAVSGRLVNVYSQNDYLLGFMYRTSALQYGVAGLQPIRGLAGIENVDVSEDIDGHTRYRFLVGGILKKIGFEDIDSEAVKEEQQALDKMLKEEKKNSLQAQRNRLMRRESYKDSKVDEDEEAEEEASDMEKQVKDKTQKSLMARVIEWWYTPRISNTQDAEQAGKTIQKVIQDPKDAKAAVGDTVKDVQASTQSYASYIASKLPSMPGGSQSPVASQTDNATKDVSKATDKATGTASGYVKAAQDYLPSMPSFSGKSQTKKPETAAEKASDTAKQAATGAQKGVAGAAGIAKDVVQPAVNNALNPKDNPAVKSAKETMGKAPIIHQASDRIPGANKAAKVTSDTVGTTVQNSAQTTSKALNATTSKATDVGSSAANVMGSGASKATDAGSGAAKTVSSGTAKATNAGKDAVDTVSSGTTKAVDMGQGALNRVSSGAAEGTKVSQNAASTVSSGAGQAAGAGQSVANVISAGASKATGIDQGAGPSVSSSTPSGKNTGQAPSKKTTPSASNTAAPGQSAPSTVSSGAGKASDAGQAAASTTKTGINTLTNAGKSFLGQAQATSGTPSKDAVKSPVKSPSTTKPQQQQQQQPDQQKPQSYFSLASSYIPSMSGNKQSPKPSTNAGTKTDTPKRSPPKLGNKASNPPTPSSAPQTKTPSSKPIPKLPPKSDRKPSDASGVKSPPPKLPRLPSSNSGVTSRSSVSAGTGAKSPTAKLERKASQTQDVKQVKFEKGTDGVKSPPKLPKLDKTASGAGKQVSEGGQAAKKQAGSWAGAATGAATGAMSGLGGLAGRMSGYGGGGK